jgi:hypothetical protein
VSTPATLTPVGYLQLETGVLVANAFGDLTSRFGVNEVARLAVHRSVQVLFQTEPYVRSRGDVGVQHAFGGAAVGAQVVLYGGGEHHPTLAASYFHSTGSGSAPDLDVGSPRQVGTVLLSGDTAGLHIDANAIFGEQTDDESRAQYGQTLSVSHAFGAITIAGELWHFTQPFSGSNAAGNLWAVSYGLSPTLVLDAGFNRGLTDTSVPWEIFSGVTYLVPRRLWGAHHR